MNRCGGSNFTHPAKVTLPRGQAAGTHRRPSSTNLPPMGSSPYPLQSSCIRYALLSGAKNRAYTVEPSLESILQKPCSVPCKISRADRSFVSRSVAASIRLRPRLD